MGKLSGKPWYSRQFDVHHTVDDGPSLSPLTLSDEGQPGAHPGRVAYLLKAIQRQAGQHSDSDDAGNTTSSAFADYLVDRIRQSLHAHAP